jgi:hypothetical protein
MPRLFIPKFRQLDRTATQPGDYVMTSKKRAIGQNVKGGAIVGATVLFENLARRPTDIRKTAHWPESFAPKFHSAEIFILASPLVFTT